MELPQALRSCIELKASGWQPSVLKNASAELTRRYKNESGSGKSLVVSELDALIYAAVRMPATYAAIYSALRYSTTGYEDGFETMLDVGAGTGAAAWAAGELFPVGSVTCLEREEAMLSLGRELAAKAGFEGEINFTGYDICGGCPDRKAELVTEAYMLNELPPEKRAQMIRGLWNCTEKMLLIVEPGTPAGFEVIREAREILLSGGAHIAAPCPHEDRCRIGEEDWCHFTARVQRSRLHKLIKGADVPYEDEKYSYIAFTREDVNRGGQRILRHPTVGKGHIRLSVCTPEENKEITVTKSSPLYKAARKAACGDLLQGGQK